MSLSRLLANMVKRAILLSWPVGRRGCAVSCILVGSKWYWMIRRAVDRSSAAVGGRLCLDSELGFRGVPIRRDMKLGQRGISFLFFTVETNRGAGVDACD